MQRSSQSKHGAAGSKAQSGPRVPNNSQLEKVTVSGGREARFNRSISMMLRSIEGSDRFQTESSLETTLGHISACHLNHLVIRKSRIINFGMILDQILV